MKICPVCQRCYDDSDTACLNDQTALVSSRPGPRLIAGKYRLERLLGRGGMGAVYAATHVDLDRLVAIKLLLSDFTSDADALERFRREARAAARLNHPNVADTFDYGVLTEGGAYIVMELVEGQTLREYMDATGIVGIAEAAEIARQVANGIEAAHRSGTVHRDLKPSNIILTRDHQEQLQAKVVDFGVAKLKEHSTTTSGGLTSSGSLIGTPRYMSPEQCSGHKTDERSDIYSMGVILYEMLAGRPPFDAPTATAIAIKHIQQPSPSLREFRPEIPLELDKFLRQVLDKDPDKRPQTAAEFASKLSEAAAGASFPSESSVAEHSKKIESRVPPAGVNISRETDPYQVRDHETHRSGQPTFEFSPDGQEINKDPSVQGYIAPPEIEAETAPKLTEPRSRERTVEAVTSAATTPKAPPTVKMDKPFIPDDRQARNRRPLLVYAIAAFAIGLIATVAWFALSRSSSETVNSNTSITESASANKSAQVRTSPTINEGASNNANSTVNQRDDSQQVPPIDARSELRDSLNAWVSSTNSGDIGKQMTYYAPTLSVFYLKRNVSQAMVRNEKTRLLSQYRTIDVRIGEPDIQIGADKETAIMRFRKSWSFTGGGTGSGEVIQELRWRKMNDGWKITSERDVEVIRSSG